MMGNSDYSAEDKRYQDLTPFSLGLDRLSHLVRSKLAMPQAVIDDMVSGIEIDQDDLESGQCSLKTILESLNCVRDLATPLHYETSEQCFDELAEEEAALCFGALGYVVKFDSIDRLRQRSLDEKATRRALRCIYRYLIGRLSRIEAPRGTEVKIAVARSCPDRDIVTIITPDKRGLHYPAGNSNLSLDKLAAIDHHPESVGLLYVSQLVRILGGEAHCGFSTDDSFTMCVCL